MEIHNTCTGGTFTCSEDLAKRLLADGGYKRGPAHHNTNPKSDEPEPAKKAAPRRRTPKTESE